MRNRLEAFPYNIYAFGTSLQDRITAVTKISDEPSWALSALEPRMGLFYKIQSQLRLFLVGKTQGFNLCLRWPPETGGERQAEHTVANSGKTNHQTDDDKTDTIAFFDWKVSGPSHHAANLRRRSPSRNAYSMCRQRPEGSGSP
jgi:hypothetical protein